MVSLVFVVTPPLPNDGVWLAPRLTISLSMSTLARANPCVHAARLLPI